MSTEDKKSLKNRLFLIDGTALAYKSHFAFRRSPLTDSQGRNISAVYGFFVTLFSLIEREKPDYMLIALDTKAPTFRHQVYPEYKATRQKMPEDMAEQLPVLRDALSASGIPILEMEGYEADDLIGTAAVTAEKQGFDVFIFTGDKDFFQLVSDKVKVYSLRKGTTDPEIIGPAEVEAKFGVPPDKVIEVLGLMGDSSDNIPGVIGIGKVKAVNLIQQYGTIQSVYQHLDEIKGSDQQKLKDNPDNALFSRQLVIIKTDCHIATDFEEWRLNLNNDALRKKFRHLEFFSLLKYLGEPQEAPAVKRNYHIIDTPEKLSDLVDKLKSSPLFAFDSETTSENPMTAKLVGLSFSFAEGEAYYIPCNGFKLNFVTKPDFTFHWHGQKVDDSTNFILNTLKPILEDPSLPKSAQNAKYDMLVLENYGIKVQGLVFDTMVAHYLLEPGARGHGLDALAMKYLRLKKIPTSGLIGSGAKQITMDQVPVKKVAEYACEDADCTFSLLKIFKPQLKEQNLSNLFSEMEIPLIPVLLTMEHNGVALDTSLLAQMSLELEEQMVEMEQGIYRLAGTQFNINSPKQLAEILFEKLNLPTARKTKTGYSTDEAVLKKLSAMDPLPAEILKYRSLAKLKNTYTDALPLLINPHTGRVHTSYNQTVAATGRLSSSDPNLQNIPVRTDTGGRIRAAFIPGKSGWKILSADYSQIELRILAHLSGDPTLVQSFHDGEDIHRRTAALVFNCPLELIDTEMRRSAKEVNFGVIYGMREFGLSERLGIPRKRAKEIIDSYFQSYPKVFEFVEQTIASVREKGYAETMKGRKRPLPEINSKNANIRQNAERIATNTPIQGSAAELIKIAMINLHRRMLSAKVRSLMIMQVHDELVFEVPEDEMELMKEMVCAEMEKALPLSVPVKVDANFGDNWLEAH